MHCVAGDGIGIIVGAAIGGVLTLAFWPDFLLEYALGFGSAGDNNHPVPVSR
jgi:hypothetical protein